MKKLFCLILYLSFHTFLHATEYMYPVATSHDETLMYFIHQLDPETIELWMWDINLNEYVQALSTRFTPAGLKILPDESGFSFVDNGLIKIKYFHKRSPKSLELIEPIYDINVPDWIDNKNCYFMAKAYNGYSIFQVDLSGNLQCIVAKSKVDCMYPQKINDNLFYIERKKKGVLGYTYKIMHTMYPQKKYSGESIQKYTPLVRNDSITSIVDFEDIPIAFLTMKSSNEGFILSYPNEINQDNEYILFHYYHIQKSNQTWQYEKLFSFIVPTELLFLNTDTRLYESILPLLPRHHGEQIYFVDMKKNNKINIFAYDIYAKNIVSIAQSQKSHLFAPLLLGNEVYYGFSNEQIVVENGLLKKGKK